MGCCLKQNKLEKPHSTSRAGTAMVMKDKGKEFSCVSSGLLEGNDIS